MTSDADLPGKRVDERHETGEGITRHARNTARQVLDGGDVTPTNLSKFLASDPLAALITAQARWELTLRKLCNDIDWEWTGSIVERRGASADFAARAKRLKKGKELRTQVVAQVAQLYDGEALPSQFKERDGAGWYLARLLQLTSRIERSLASGHSEDAVAAALELGQVDCEFAIKTAKEPNWIIGQKLRNAGKKGRNAQLGFPSPSDNFWPLYQQLINEGVDELEARKRAAAEAGITLRHALRFKHRYAANGHGRPMST